MWGNSTGAIRKWQDTRWTAPRLQRCSLIPDQRTSHHKALHAHWITGWDLWEFITLWKSVECSGKQGEDYSSSPLVFHETTCQSC